VFLSDFGHAPEEGDDVVPLGAMPHLMLEDLLDRCTMMSIQLDAIGHGGLQW
jgi:hypothetical protein